VSLFVQVIAWWVAASFLLTALWLLCVTFVRRRRPTA
jgi:hypothetical protein